MNTKKTVIIPILLFLMSGCAITHTQKIAVSEQEAQDNYDRTYYKELGGRLKDHEAIVVKEIVNYLKLKHPETRTSTPRLNIKQVSAQTELGEALMGIFNKSAKKLLPVSKQSPVWDAYVEVNFMRRKDNQRLDRDFLAIPTWVLCFTTVFTLCPYIDTQIFALDVTIKEGDRTIKKIRAYGGTDTYTSSVVINEYENVGEKHKPEAMRAAEALSAAVADFADKYIDFVDTYQSNK